MNFPLSNPSEVLQDIQRIMTTHGYSVAEYNRYALLIEEGLIKWKEDAGLAQATYIFQETSKRVRMIIKCRGAKSYPFDSASDDEDYLGRMHDRLLSGTGCEIAYRYICGNNQIILTLPKKDHEYNLFKMNVWALAIPVAIQYLFTNIISATDSILMGIMDQDSLSAISITGSFMTLYTILIAALVAGTTIFASQYWGKRDWNGINRIFSVSLRYSMFCSIVFFIPSFFCPRAVMRLYTNIPELIDLGSRYLRITSGVFLCSGFYQVANGIMRNTGKVMLSTVFLTISSVVNFLLDIILIFGLCGIRPMGIEGAAIATLAASVVNLLLTIAECIRNKNIHISLCFKQDTAAKHLIRDYLIKSYPLAIQMVTWTLADNICTSIFGHMDTNIVAANGVIDIVQRLGVFAMAGLYETCGILIGGKLGGGELDTAKLYSKRYLRFTAYVGAITFAATLLLNVFAEYLPLSLTSQAFYYLHILLIVEAFEMFFIGINGIMNSGAFYAGGDTKALMVIDTINMWGIIVPVGLLCLYVFNLPAIWIAIFLHMDELTSFPFKYLRYKKYKWLKKIT